MIFKVVNHANTKEKYTNTVHIQIPQFTIICTTDGCLTLSPLVSLMYRSKGHMPVVNKSPVQHLQCITFSESRFVLHLDERRCSKRFSQTLKVFIHRFEYNRQSDNSSFLFNYQLSSPSNVVSELSKSNLHRHSSPLPIP